MSRPIPNIFAMLLVVGSLACSGGQPAGDGSPAAAAPPEETSAALRLYVFDCGNLRIADPGRF